MKKIIYIIFISIAGMYLTSCDTDIEQVKVAPNPTAPTLKSPAAPDGLLYTKDDANKKIGFSWTEADFGFQASITYGIQISQTADFAVTSDILTSQDLSDSVLVGDLNSVLLAWGMTPGEQSTIYCRAFAKISDYVETEYSEAFEYNVVPYETLIDYPMIYVPGAYQGWSPGAENGRLFSYDFNRVYEGIVRITPTADNNGEFKITSDPDWSHTNWGGTLTQSGNTYVGELDPAGGNYAVTPGTYEFVVDVNALTIELTATDDWGIIGSAVPPYDWSEDVNLFYNGQRKMWEITADFEAGEFKFRANDDWALNYGDTGADGSIEAGGDNIALPEAGNYTIRLDLNNMRYYVIKN